MQVSTRATGLAAVALFVWLLPVTASAQETAPVSLKLPTVTASVAAAADWASTYHALKYYRLREANPLLRPLDDRPGKLVSMGALMDAGAISAWNMTVGRSNPRVAAAGLWAMTAFRAYLVVHNMRNARKAVPR